MCEDEGEPVEDLFQVLSDKCLAAWVKRNTNIHNEHLAAQVLNDPWDTLMDFWHEGFLSTEEHGRGGFNWLVKALGLTVKRLAKPGDLPVRFQLSCGGHVSREATGGTNWIATGILARGFISLLVGEAGSTKSTFTQSLMMSTSRGEAFGPFHVPRAALPVDQP